MAFAMERLFRPLGSRVGGEVLTGGVVPVGGEERECLGDEV